MTEFEQQSLQIQEQVLFEQRKQTTIAAGRIEIELIRTEAIVNLTRMSFGEKNKRMEALDRIMDSVTRTIND